jgi:flagellar hook assembly protein FlgD
MLFSSIEGRQDLEIAFHGRLSTGREVATALLITVKGKQATSRRFAATFMPNPMNPTGALKLSMTARGSVTVRVFGLSGRLVRTLARGQILEAGDHTFVLDGRDDRGTVMASGVYYYRIESPDGMRMGRFAIAK